MRFFFCVLIYIQDCAYLVNFILIFNYKNMYILKNYRDLLTLCLKAGQF
ncbi:MAG: hypothetical protein LBD88_03775 [Candidatus Peribacteria bacterium]|nr:hypothetical protein [Candidatus Peribacteria bacterium]